MNDLNPQTNPVIAATVMDRSVPLGNSLGTDNRNALHTKIRNTSSEPIITTSAIVSQNYDAVSVSYPDPLTEVYTFKTGGLIGTTVATVTIIYTSSSKQNISTVERT